MKKSGRRLVIAPASMAYSSDSKHGKVSAESVVAFEIEVVRVCKKNYQYLCAKPAGDSMKCMKF